MRRTKFGNENTTKSRTETNSRNQVERNLLIARSPAWCGICCPSSKAISGLHMIPLPELALLEERGGVRGDALPGFNAVPNIPRYSKRSVNGQYSI